MIENSNRALTGVVIDPGNGGDDIGATGNGLKEKDFNLEVSKYMFDRLNELGVPTTITRTNDIDLDANTRIEKALQAYGNSDDVIIISNHLNAGGDGFTYHY